MRSHSVWHKFEPIDFIGIPVMGVMDGDMVDDMGECMVEDIIGECDMVEGMVVGLG